MFCPNPFETWSQAHAYATQKQSDYKVEQSSLTLIALFSLEIGRCRGRNWLNGNQALRSFRLYGDQALLTIEHQSANYSCFLSEEKLFSVTVDLNKTIIAAFIARLVRQSEKNKTKWRNNNVLFPRL